MSTPVLTLNSRGNILLEVTRDHFGLSTSEVRKEISNLHAEVQQILASKGIKYSELKSALVPGTDRHEAAFFFDSNIIKECDYGWECFSKVLLLLDEKGNHSILGGDLLGNDQRFLSDALEEQILLCRNFQFIHGTLIYCIYINNITKAGIERVVQGLGTFLPFFGFANTTFESRLKVVLSLCLVNVCIKKERTVILAHEDDRSNLENVDIRGLPFEESGYRILSLQERLFGVMLSFKIERPVISSFATDTEFAINSITEHVLDIRNFEVLIEENKFEYLLREKTGTLDSAGWAAKDRTALSDAIKRRIAANYIYNMEYLDKYSIMKFAMIVEVNNTGSPVRLNVALEYIPSKKVLRVITLY